VPLRATDAIGINGIEPTINSDDVVERAAIIEHGAGVPRAWAEGYARLCIIACPASIPPTRWRRLIDNAGDFIDRFAVQAAALGWDAKSIFGCHPIAPDARLDYAGLAWLIGTGRVVAITADSAVICSPDGATLTYRRASCHGATLAWELSGTTPADVE